MALLNVACINVKYLPEYSIKKNEQCLEVGCDPFSGHEDSSQSTVILNLIANAVFICIMLFTFNTVESILRQP